MHAGPNAEVGINPGQRKGVSLPPSTQPKADRIVFPPQGIRVEIGVSVTAYCQRKYKPAMPGQW
jgi:hypothetical protein